MGQVGLNTELAKLFRDPGDGIYRSAILSHDKKYRYHLSRIWQPHHGLLIWIMLNPSTADALQDDPTIRVCMGRARNLGFGGIIVLNLFAYRTAYPEEILEVDDPVSPFNNGVIKSTLALRQYSRPIVVAAWGDWGMHNNRDRKVRRLAKRAGITLHHLGLTKRGNPRHPLRLSYEQPLTRWED